MARYDTLIKIECNKKPPWARRTKGAHIAYYAHTAMSQNRAPRLSRPQRTSRQPRCLLGIAGPEVSAMSPGRTPSCCFSAISTSSAKLSRRNLFVNNFWHYSPRHLPATRPIRNKTKKTKKTIRAIRAVVPAKSPGPNPRTAAPTATIRKTMAHRNMFMTLAIKSGASFASPLRRPLNIVINDQGYLTLSPRSTIELPARDAPLKQRGIASGT